MIKKSNKVSKNILSYRSSKIKADKAFKKKGVYSGLFLLILLLSLFFLNFLSDFGIYKIKTSEIIERLSKLN